MFWVGLNPVETGGCNSCHSFGINVRNNYVSLWNQIAETSEASAQNKAMCKAAVEAESCGPSGFHSGLIN